MNYFSKKHTGYSALYVDYEDGTVRLDRYELHYGFNLYKVIATYKRDIPGAQFFVAAQNEKEALQKFKTVHGDVLSIIKTCRRAADAEVHYALTHPAKVMLL